MLVQTGVPALFWDEKRNCSLGQAGQVSQTPEEQHSLHAGPCCTSFAEWPVLVWGLADVTIDGSVDLGLQPWAETVIHLQPWSSALLSPVHLEFAV